jgi:hypothetical protein
MAPHRVTLGALVLLAVAVATDSSATATIIDSFTDPLPAHPSLPASGASVLFLGSRCDGVACPPGTIVTNPGAFDGTEQSGLPGIVAPFRKAVFATYFEPNPGSSGTLFIDPTGGGSLAVETPGGPPLAVILDYGDRDRPVNLDLRADGSDHFEIDILDLSVPQFGSVSAHVAVGGNGGFGSGEFAVRSYSLSGPGTLVVPYADLAGLDEFDDHVRFFTISFIVYQGGATTRLAVGEIRTASTPTAAAGTSWGRIKSAYRR